MPRVAVAERALELAVGVELDPRDADAAGRVDALGVDVDHVDELEPVERLGDLDLGPAESTTPPHGTGGIPRGERAERGRRRLGGAVVAVEAEAAGVDASRGCPASRTRTRP